MALAIFFLLGLTGPALAGLDICNQTEETQSVALGYKGATDWASKGWWNIKPGDCATVVTGDLTQRYYYYFADSKSGLFRGQHYSFCIRDVAFELVGDTGCDKRGYEASSFREIDTGQAATSFTLTLVKPANPGNSAKAPGGGGGSNSSAAPTGAVATQEPTTSPETPNIDTDVAALTSDLPPGRSGAPFKMRGIFQGCELEGGRAFCSFHSGGIKFRAFYGGPTPEDLLFALEGMKPSTALEFEGDTVETRGSDRAVVFRAVKDMRGADPFAQLRAALQGDWVSDQDRHSEITIRASEIYARYRGAYKSTRYLELADSCQGAAGSGSGSGPETGPVMLQRVRGQSQAKCYQVTISRGRLELRPARQGDTLLFRRP